ncbi:hypothetical protein DFS34DRAFT_677659 [Phlyctochytrium arcticum]|nr:hypothetical protein DFS34DRAFT_677659 [Phlyctochytrium arcticum]
MSPGWVAALESSTANHHMPILGLIERSEAWRGLWSLEAGAALEGGKIQSLPHSYPDYSRSIFTLTQTMRPLSTLRTHYYCGKRQPQLVENPNLRRLDSPRLSLYSQLERQPLLVASNKIKLAPAKQPQSLCRRWLPGPAHARKQQARRGLYAKTKARWTPEDVERNKAMQRKWWAESAELWVPILSNAIKFFGDSGIAPEWEFAHLFLGNAGVDSAKSDLCAVSLLPVSKGDFAIPFLIVEFEVGGLVAVAEAAFELTRLIERARPTAAELNELRIYMALVDDDKMIIKLLVPKLCSPGNNADSFIFFVELDNTRVFDLSDKCLAGRLWKF